MTAFLMVAAKDGRSAELMVAPMESLQAEMKAASSAEPWADNLDEKTAAQKAEMKAVCWVEW